MAGRDRLKALQLMERISRHRMESIGAEMAGLRAAQAELGRQIRALDDATALEAAQTTDQTRPYLPAYLRSVTAQQDVWAREQDAIEEQVAQLEGRLLGAFREVKTQETVRERVERDITQENERAETARLDDASRSLYVLARQRAASKR